MSDEAIYLVGTLRAGTIELVTPCELPDGQAVVMSVTPIGRIPHGLLKSFGAWSDDPAGLDKFVKQVYRDRETDRRNDPAAGTEQDDENRFP